jgi:PIN domain nuclease of toxin-antitoxin system
VILLDTHVLVRYLMGDKKLGRRAVASIDKVLPDDEVFVSAISFWEVAMFVERRRLRSYLQS